jgi:hypothetical protein
MFRFQLLFLIVGMVKLFVAPWNKQSGGDQIGYGVMLLGTETRILVIVLSEIGGIQLFMNISNKLFNVER